MFSRKSHEDGQGGGRASALRRVAVVLVLAGSCLAAGHAGAQAIPNGVVLAPRIRPASVAGDTCRVIREEAVRRGLPPDFLARLIWKESAFTPAAVSPKGAQGIAQFMAATAAERSLANPFDAAPAIAASAHYLADLRAQFGNLGFAAAAYNAGPTRVQSWRDGAGTLPAETQDYVHWITGHTADEWSAAKTDLSLPPVVAKLPFETACVKLASRERAAHVPAGFQRTAAAAAAISQLGLGIKRVEASKPGRVRVLITIGEPSRTKAKPGKRKRR